MIASVINLKGGVGKSTTASALAYGAVSRGKRVLSVDLDGQRSLSFLMRADEQAPSILEVLLGEVSVSEAVQHTEQGDLIPASPTLAGADLVITGENMKLRLQEILKPIKNDYDGYKLRVAECYKQEFDFVEKIKPLEEFLNNSVNV